MKLDTGEYVVVSLDADGCELGTVASDNLKDAKRQAKLRIGCDEDIAAGMVKIEVRNDRGECLADYFV